MEPQRICARCSAPHCLAARCRRRLSPADGQGPGLIEYHGKSLTHASDGNDFACRTYQDIAHAHPLLALPRCHFPQERAATTTDFQHMPSGSCAPSCKHTQWKQWLGRKAYAPCYGRGIARPNNLLPVVPGRGEGEGGWARGPRSAAGGGAGLCVAVGGGGAPRGRLSRLHVRAQKKSKGSSTSCWAVQQADLEPVASVCSHARVKSLLMRAMLLNCPRLGMGAIAEDHRRAGFSQHWFCDRSARGISTGLSCTRCVAAG